MVSPLLELLMEELKEALEEEDPWLERVVVVLFVEVGPRERVLQLRFFLG